MRVESASWNLVGSKSEVIRFCVKLIRVVRCGLVSQRDSNNDIEW
jgi:hypothetical protein